MLHALAIPTLIAFGLGQVTNPAEPPRRYVSSQAYYHALRAELALAQDDLTRASDELTLALVYDGKSLFLTERLTRLCLRLGRTRKARRLVDGAKATAPRNPLVWLLDAEVARASSDWPKAERALQRAVRLDRHALEPAMALARHLSERGRFREAIRVLSQIAARQPQAHEPLALMAVLQSGAHRYGKAAEALERALARNPRGLELWQRLDDLYERLERGSEGAQALADFHERRPSDVEGSLAAGEALAREGRLDEAEACFEAARERAPEIEERIARAWIRQGYFQRAIPILEQQRQLHSNSSALRVALAQAQRQAGRGPEALAHFVQIPATAPEAADAQLAATELLLEAGRRRRAQVQLERAHKEHSESAPLALALAKSRWAEHATLGDLEAQLPLEARRDLAVWWAAGPADDTLEERIEAVLRPLSARQRAEAKASVMAAQGKLEPAAKAVRAAWRQAADADQWARWASWQLGSKRGRRWAKQAFQRAPRSPLPLGVYGRALLQAGDTAHALDVFDRGVRLHPYEWKLWEGRGDALAASGGQAKAKAAYQRAKKMLKLALRRHDAHPAQLAQLTTKLQELQ